ncbi:hypothetical protein D6764_00135 [Candidatus Woesearchaeota archaeon]|nr:MAG: hypothetical protein D6764_00135 [Candidatus Woesearchaeota archaeon]
MGFQLERRIGKYRIKFFENLQNKYKAKHLVNGLKELRKLIEEKIKQDVEQHYVEKALKEEEEAVKQIKEIEEATGILMRNIFVEEDQELQDLEKWEKNILLALKKYHSILSRLYDQMKKEGREEEAKKLDEELRNFQERFAHLIIEDAEKREKYLREEYKKFFTVLAAAEHPEEEKFMESITAFWKDENASYLDYWLIRREAREELKIVKKEKKEHEKEYKRITTWISDLDKELDKAEYHKDRKLAGIIHSEILQITKDVARLAEMFDRASKMAHKAIMRIVILDLSLLALAKELIRGNMEYVKQILMPKSDVEKVNEEVSKDLVKEIDDMIREYAQAIRIELRELYRTEDLAKKIAKAA